VPCYNVARLCGAVLREAVGYAARVVAVDDGSSDETAAVLRQVASEYLDGITVLSLGTNRGKGFALLAGLKHALEHLDFDALVTLDGDGQHLPCDIPDLSRLVWAGADMAIGERRFALMPLRSRLGNRLTSARVGRMYPAAPVDTQSGLRAFSRGFAEEIVRQVPGSRYEMELNCLLLALS
jgi:glycosyltransferase involved in cell wall biosynthesis